MFVKILIYYMLGYVNVTVEGFFIEKFINTCICKRILFWNTKRTKSTVFSACIGVKDFRDVAKIAQKCKCKIKINYKKGLPFLLNKYRKRKIFAISLVIIVALIIITSNFIWNIEVVGVDDEKLKNEITELIKKDGVYIGKNKNKINLQNLINDIRIERDDIAWVGMQIKGTNLLIEIVKADNKPEIVDESDYCNIVAKKDGIIVKVQAQNGTPVVKEGDVIKSGDVLIKGEMEGKFTGTRLVHSQGEVLAKVWYSDTEKVYYNQIIGNQTGKKEKKYTINVNNFQINLFKTLSKFEKYDTIRKIKKFKLTSNFYLPVQIIVNENVEKEISNVTYNKSEATEIGMENAKSRLNEQVKQNVLNTYVNTNETDEYVEVEVIYEVLEDIGTKQKM